ncbi:MAG: glycoside hydrolase family 3 N-terminal domain-containing protein [Pedobacter sp.]|uniref:glycoside hydrolase family 3 N-terminal domain-containing protein n=1 Tax=Pedobacter sp. TaxID=1411316 RepID=UPI0028081069|nr:glycoside hydrolase family 3 N-terminal domain-containing protein [Pedobacter sp.]MDQ8004256.1 glycoside hydrolase family 3 N-terminal domain-containing protein [Pedobacter sp.]
MNKKFLTIPLLALSLLATAQQKTDQAIDQKVKTLLGKMTLEEKVGQMAQITMDVITNGKDRFSSYEPVALNQQQLEHALVKYKVGSVLNTANNRARTPQVWHQIINKIQETGKGRLKIPVLYGIDAIHGTTYTAGATMFPQQIGQAAARNRNLVYKGAEITAYETRASAIPWNFSPVLDLAPDPRFPRQWETFGEDPFLISELGVQMIKGFEGNNIADPYRVASCLKHFIGYQVSASGKDRTPAYIPDHVLRDHHLPPFKAAIEAGAHSIMINSGVINGVPVHANYHLLTKLLREELGFKGLIVTDWGDIENLHTRDKVAKDHKEAIMLAINAGIDMSMIAYDYERFCDNLIALVKEGKVKESRIDDAVTNILTLKYKLGLFEKAVYDLKQYPKFGSKEFEQAAYQSAAESITLLKNKGDILPLKKGIKLLVTGPNANSMRTLNGGWTYSWQGEKVEEFAAKYNTILEAVSAKAGKENVTFVEGVSYKMDGKYYEEFENGMDKAVTAAKDADAIVLCLGENSYTESPGNLSDLYISDLQTQLAQKLGATGKPIILVLNEGRPRLISKFEAQMAGVLQTYLPGNFGGDALADILFGDINPSGKLPYNYPKFPNSLVGYNHKPSENRTVMEGVYNYDAEYNPQYEFGFGLSYTTFKYDNLKLSAEKINSDQELTVSVEVSNTGNREGKEVVELYLSDLYATLTPDSKRLRGFEKINLKPGEKQTVIFKLGKKDFSFTHLDGKSVVEPGEFSIKIGSLKKNFNIN